MKLRRELFALAVVVLLLAGLPFAVLAYQQARSALPDIRTIDIVARQPDVGGFAPDLIRVQRGETVRLRLSSTDVVHGFEIPGLGIQAPDIYPGQVVEVTFTPQQAGRFPFTCTRWCSSGHWRMRGVIEVAEPAGGQVAATPEPPLYLKLNIDPDAMPALDDAARASLAALETTPSASRGAQVSQHLSADLVARATSPPRSPAEVWTDLRRQDSALSLSDAELWDLIAYVWNQEADDATIRRGGALYARDCAACHGETGRGDGPAGRGLPGMRQMMPEMRAGPADFTERMRMAAVSDLMLQAKLARGGMGTGMPEFGSLYAAADQDAVIAFLRQYTLAGNADAQPHEPGCGSEAVTQPVTKTLTMNSKEVTGCQNPAASTAERP
jgi:mono/diheme cytochrome c family protein